jgi:hypothetical protein
MLLLADPCGPCGDVLAVVNLYHSFVTVVLQYYDKVYGSVGKIPPGYAYLQQAQGRLPCRQLKTNIMTYMEILWAPLLQN